MDHAREPGEAADLRPAAATSGMGRSSFSTSASHVDVILGRRTVSFGGLAALVQIAGITGGKAKSTAPGTETTLSGKVIVGYQGWFGCPGDSAGTPTWRHWFNAAGTLAVDMLPDVSALPASERCATPMRHPDGSPVYVFSSRNYGTVLRHFRMMQRYGIDGVALQRFVVSLRDAHVLDELDQVLRNVRCAAEQTGRTFFVMYDNSGAGPDTWGQDLVADWHRLTHDLGVTASAAYQQDAGHPLLAVWGLGFADRPAKPEPTQLMIDQLVPPDRPKSLTLLAGVPREWRRLARPAEGTGWSDAYARFDIICPWTVGAYTEEKSADQYGRNLLVPDLQATAAHGQTLMPVVFPGFSAANLRHDPTMLDKIPRHCGRLLRRQIDNAVRAGVRTLYVAMFDEVDEGTAILPITEETNELPAGERILASDSEACGAGPDLYMKIVGETARRLKTSVSR